MTLDRRQIVGLFATTAVSSAVATLAGCGGGGSASVEIYDDPYEPPYRPTGYAWILNLHPEYTALDVDFNDTIVASNLPFRALSQRIELDPGTYTLGLQNQNSDFIASFGNYTVGDRRSRVNVIYRKGSVTQKSETPSGIVNYFESSEALVIELDEATTTGVVQTSVMPFETTAIQISPSPNCRLRVRRSSDGVLVYNSGVVKRARAIILFQTDPAFGYVGAVGVDYQLDAVNGVINPIANVALWPNQLT
jgi:hypothetical protein